MKTLGMALLTVAILAGAAAFSRPGDPAALTATSEKRNPWTGLRLNNDPETFHFAVIGDRTGGHRARVFSQAVARLNVLQPAFVMSVGDLIEGGKKAKPKLEAEWKEFDGYVNKLTMPFFYVPGNHDVGQEGSDAVWRERYGRRWYHFVYKGVLFLCLNSDDGKATNLGNEQVAYATKALADNKDVRHAVVIVHKPIWTGDVAKNGWGAVERALGTRPATVFCGHVHRYRKFVRNGRSYYQLATTGGGSKLRGVPYGEFDHVAWVTMKKDGPVIANVLLDGVLPDDLKVPESDEKGVVRKRGKTYPVKGTVFRNGVPLAGAQVSFKPKEKDKGVAGDGMTESDGTFVASTYAAFDGLEVGTYQVTVTLRRPLYLPDGKAGPNTLPARYADAAKSGIAVEIKAGENEVKIELE